MSDLRACHLKMLLCSIICAGSAKAQSQLNDSLNNSLFTSYPVGLYFTEIGENAHIYNGYEYFTPDRSFRGTPYYLSEAAAPSELSYDNNYYQNIPILYDQVLDAVVVNRLGQNYKISLLSAKLSSFSLRSHQFMRLSHDSSQGAALVTGFYDKIYGGKSAIFVKRKKFVKETLEYSAIINEYKEVNTYYVFFQDKYVLVEGKNGVLKLFGSKKSEIKAFLRKNKLNYTSDFEKALISTAAFYDQPTS